MCFSFKYSFSSSNALWKFLLAVLNSIILIPCYTLSCPLLQTFLHGFKLGSSRFQQIGQKLSRKLVALTTEMCFSFLQGAV